jgi:hypothetical protein
MPALLAARAAEEGNCRSCLMFVAMPLNQDRGRARPDHPINSAIT